MSKKLWGTRFSKKIDPLFEEFSSSINIDKELAEFDIMGSLIHVGVLKEAGIVSKGEYTKLSKGLEVLKKAVQNGKFAVDAASEDIHSDIQNKLEKSLGNVALKLHTARSRNDQVVFDTKFYCKKNSKVTAALVSALSKVISNTANKFKAINIPGYTHLQHAQPVSLANYFLAYSDMLARDAKRLSLSADNIKLSLGSGALAGTQIDSKYYKKVMAKLASKLGLKFGKDISTVSNSIDNVSDRDFILEALSTLAIISMHISRLAEDLIMWSSSEFDFVELDDAFCTGSSLMPQKKNPDSLELIRGNTGKLYGNLMSVLVTMKGLPLSYNRDMQLDKEPLFSSFKIIKDEIKILSKLIPTLKVNKDKIEKQLKGESLYITDLAFYLATKGVAFKEAHEIMGNLVRFSLEKNLKIKEMSNEQLKKFSKFLDKSVVRKMLDPVYSVNSKKSIKG